MFSSPGRAAGSAVAAEALAGSGVTLHLIARNEEKLALVADIVAESGTRFDSPL